jgi:hypothetical protein
MRSERKGSKLGQPRQPGRNAAAADCVTGRRDATACAACRTTRPVDRTGSVATTTAPLALRRHKVAGVRQAIKTHRTETVRPPKTSGSFRQNEISGSFRQNAALRLGRAFGPSGPAASARHRGAVVVCFNRGIVVSPCIVEPCGSVAARRIPAGCRSKLSFEPFAVPKREAERRNSRVRKRHTHWPALRQGLSRQRTGLPVHDADRRASRRSTAAISLSSGPSYEGGRSLSGSRSRRLSPAFIRLRQSSRTAPRS